MFLFLASFQHSLHHLKELIQLLPQAFPGKKNKLESIIYYFFLLNHCKSNQIQHLSKLFFLLEPFMKECKNDESFLFFILNHQKEIAVLLGAHHLVAFIAKLYPQGLTSLQKHLCDHFHKKGYPYLLPTVKSLIDQVKNT
jgi:hypothetical protein